MPPHVAIVILAYNGLQDTIRCLDSLENPVKEGQGVSALLVDNGSTDGTEGVVSQRFPWCPVLRIPKNNGPAAGNNQGIRHALQQGAQWVLLLNNDTTVHKDFVARMSSMAEQPDGFRILGPVINYMDDADVVMTDGVRFNRKSYRGFFERVPVPVRDACPPQVTEVDVVNGCCMMIHAEVFRRIGFFDESLFIYHDESDFCVRASLAGFRSGVFASQLVWHKGSSTFKTSGKRLQRYYDARNLGILVWQYAGKLPQSRSRVASLLKYARYLYWRFAVEREEGHPAAADAVIEGFIDFMSGRRGAYAPLARPALPILRKTCELGMKLGRPD
jgi:GT2 family glycosyltransferase